MLLERSRREVGADWYTNTRYILLRAHPASSDTPLTPITCPAFYHACALLDRHRCHPAGITAIRPRAKGDHGWAGVVAAAGCQGRRATPGCDADCVDNARGHVAAPPLLACRPARAHRIGPSGGALDRLTWGHSKSTNIDKSTNA